jgi:hypothetical protein
MKFTLSAKYYSIRANIVNTVVVNAVNFIPLYTVYSHILARLSSTEFHAVYICT